MRQFKISDNFYNKNEWDKTTVDVYDDNLLIWFETEDTKESIMICKDEIPKYLEIFAFMLKETQNEKV
jgi:hypothetical protein